MTSIKTKKTLIIISCVLLLICNWPGVKNISGLNDWYYRYSNYSGTYTSLEEPRVGYVITADLSNGKFHLNYDKNNPKGYKEDTVVYRLFKMRPYEFWRWGEFMFSQRFRIPYMDWKEIVKRRGFEKIDKPTGSMVF